LPFIQQTRMIIDASDQVANLCALDTPPFPIYYCRAMCTAPAVEGPSGHQELTAKDANIISKINDILALYSTKSKPASILLPASNPDALSLTIQPFQR
jgi:hypothetical protein